MIVEESVFKAFIRLKISKRENIRSRVKVKI